MINIRKGLGALALFTALAGATPAPAAQPDKGPGAARGKFAYELFQAVLRRNVREVKALLGKGADPNARNGLEFTPLIFAAASSQPDVMEALLAAGAKLEAESPFGSALSFAAQSGSVASIKFLLSRGANVNAKRQDELSVLMLASEAGAAEVIPDLFIRKAIVDAKAIDGTTALISAARQGHVEVGRALLECGAGVEISDSHGRTPLMYAAMNGRERFVELLLEKGARTDPRDQHGNTALLLAASYGDYPAVVRALAKHGANLSVVDAHKRSPLAIARQRSYRQAEQVLAGLMPDGGARAGETPNRMPLEAVRSGLKALEQSMRVFNQRTGCNSCHHEGLGRMATGEALRRGLALDAALTRAQAQRLEAQVNGMSPLNRAALKDPKAMTHLPLIEIDEVSFESGYLLAGMAAQKQSATAAIGEMTMVLARQQKPAGFWTSGTRRIPMQSSNFTSTALAVKALRTYGPRPLATEVQERVRRAAAWLASTPAEDTESRTFKLLGLSWAENGEAEIQRAAKDLLDHQNADGGWSQLPGMPSDAYATGEALYALGVAGKVSAKDPAFDRGTQFLLRTQDPDGSWFVNKRAIQANNYLDGGFAHGQSQYSSFNASCWATMALLQTLEPRSAQARPATR